MKKTLIALTMIFILGSASAEKTSSTSWYENLLKGLKTKIQRKLESKNRVTAVAAVRGAKQGENASALYWKGSVSEQAQKKLEGERKQLTDAVELVVNGQAAEGRAALEKFIKDNPESLFMPDAKEALNRMPAESQAAVSEGAEQEEEAPVKPKARKAKEPVKETQQSDEE